MSSVSLKEFFSEVLELIDAGIISNKRELNKWKAKLARKHSLESIPSNPDIMCSGGKISRQGLEILCKKPVRSLSGITVVAAMVPPHKCPGECTYCPSSLVEQKTPKSYTGREPATMRALQSNFDAGIQVRERLRQLRESGHSLAKVEFIVMGGTLFAQGKTFQENFMLGALNAFTGKHARAIERAKLYAENSGTRITGITFETRPDYCTKKIVDRMLSYGGTRCELGVQILNDRVYKRVKRGHTIADVENATRNLKDAGFKVLYHTMPGLPHASFQEDLDSFKRIFFSEPFKPDMLKIYPCLVVKGTQLYKEFLEGDFHPMDEEGAVKLISRVKGILPLWIRIMRIQRDIPSQLIEGGVKKSNLRQLVERELSEKKRKCNCIRCREAALKKYRHGTEFRLEESRLFLDEYRASSGTELFISLEARDRNALFGYCRLRVPDNSYRKEIGSNSAIIRELRVFGEPLSLGKRKKEALQHRGIGQRLFTEAERIAREVFDRKRLTVIAGLGVREYYRKKFQCKNDGPYVSKTI